MSGLTGSLEKFDRAQHKELGKFSCEGTLSLFTFSNYGDSETAIFGAKFLAVVSGISLEARKQANSSFDEHIHPVSPYLFLRKEETKTSQAMKDAIP